MGRLPTNNRKYQLQTLNNMHHEVLRHTLLGFKPKQIADLLGITEATVMNVIHGAKGRQLLSLMQGARDANTIDLAKDLAEYAPQCIRVLKDCIEDPNQPMPVRAKYALEMVGLAGYVKPQRVQIHGAVAHLTADEIEQIKKRARLLAQESGVIDVEYKEQDSDQGGLSGGQESSSLESEEADLP